MISQESTACVERTLPSAGSGQALSAAFDVDFDLAFDLSFSDHPKINFNSSGQACPEPAEGSVRSTLAQ
jgi:hypothetical protein